ncbi:MAG: aldo/keto reductase [Methanotrichaceae archaeon]|nr:aldo/keto reductase [Methanotrichaceae archaeon]
MELSKEVFGKNGPLVTRVGLGGEGVLRTFNRINNAMNVIEKAAVEGINYFDSAKAYAGSESYYGKFWSKHSTLRSNIFQTSKSASRDKEGAYRDLANTLDTMNLDYLDLWQIHDVRTWDDVKRIEEPSGALEAFSNAKDTGIARFIGVTGHYDPRTLKYCVSNWPIDAVLLPVNPVEAALGGFMDSVLSVAQDIGLAAVGMKVLGASNYILQDSSVTPERLIRYALSQRITTIIVGCSTPLEVQTLANIGSNFKPMPPEEQQHLVEIFRPHSKKMAFYRGPQ